MENLNKNKNIKFLINEIKDTLNDFPLNDFQRLAYLKIKEILESIDEGKINISKSTIKIKEEKGNFWIDISLRPLDFRSFNLWIGIFVDGISLGLGKWHQDYLIKESGLSEDKFLENFIKILIEIFKGNVKIIEYQSNGKGYKWIRYDLIEGKWQPSGAVGLIFYNYFGRRTRIDKFCRLY